MLETLTTPEAILSDCWARLSAGATDAGSAFHTPVVAISHEETGASVRTVVLRRVDPAQRLLFFHTDRRSPKFESLHHERKAAWLFYDPALKLQLRVLTTTTLHTEDAIAHEMWRTTPAETRALYGSPLTPGTPLPGPLLSPPAPASDGRDNFAVVRCEVVEIDWLFLHPTGHRRIRFTLDDEHVTSTWLAP